MELLIILEMAQIFVVQYIDGDAEMSYALPTVAGSADQWELKHCQVQNYSLHEDLGQVDYLFCDKTGTLTKNELVFNKWASGGLVEFERRVDSLRQEESERVKNLLRCICLCHDVLLISLENAQGLSSQQMSGASQDELCLLDSV
mmetsp:Transcript_2373/g.3007  ORF Transcript_2373/g.3007 Transcript_2373/m.3007 type:complete len:145 (-) Transcript_2373:255-689(-)|eukprot:CAMPEP_0170451696 /NCGR_PEP_ID=MMETSP0123-20130129/851_1 /TAXON_ID=182087 /ORGANISM="Favella ehrenbergii, Strain Fehren 1" /LENGTH=144 /DNA_ID=CAMNT_0010713473 /DNA_START=912 /DNA_END=1346 /DNA_ORIENTATION=-